ncbi:Retrovirus-related Pol polyprotein from transposon opus [Dictyocoela muelleri]|nr:Retrovirus-related Pol polyprotein from transposon opus [Dictyocoela muelleri]
MKFLREHDAVIDFKQKTLLIDDIEYKLNEDEDICFADKSLIDKSKIFQIKNYENNIESLIKSYKERNPKLGDIKTFYHRIILEGEFKKILNEYPVPLGIREEVEEHINDLINAGVIKEAETDFISPAFIIRKKNGKLRLVVDYRYLNSLTRKNHQYIPKISEILASLKNSKVFSQLSLNQGYYQIRMHPDDINKTGFKILRRTFIFNKMPFGLCNAPTTFQLTMENILKGVSNVFIYLDDILVFSENRTEHFKHLEIVLNRLIEAGVSINFEKSKFGLESVNYLGHVITSCGIKPEISKVETFEQRPIKTKKHLERILWFFNWFRPFIQNLSIKTSTLYDKLKNTKRYVNLNDEDRKIINEIFQVIKQQPNLHYPNFNLPFDLNCDASDKGIGSILLQQNKLIGYYSKKYSKTENNYTIVEKEFWLF